MPTYSYRCTACDAAFDLMQDFTDDALTTCEACAGKVRKLLYAVGVTFQGSGFYRTDSRAEAKKSSSASTEKKAAPKKESSSTPAATTT